MIVPPTPNHQTKSPIKVNRNMYIYIYYIYILCNIVYNIRMIEGVSSLFLVALSIGIHTCTTSFGYV